MSHRAIHWSPAFMQFIIIIIIIIHVFHRDASLEQNFRAAAFVTI